MALLVVVTVVVVSPPLPVHHLQLIIFMEEWTLPPHNKHIVLPSHLLQQQHPLPLLHHDFSKQHDYNNVYVPPDDNDYINENIIGVVYDRI